MPFTYILRCADKTLYVGHTEDLALREQTHNEGKGARDTATRRPVRMIFAEQHTSSAAATARERQLKRWNQKKKEALIADDRVALSSLARRRMKSGGFTWRDLLNHRS